MTGSLKTFAFDADSNNPLIFFVSFTSVALTDCDHVGWDLRVEDFCVA